MLVTYTKPQLITGPEFCWCVFDLKRTIFQQAMSHCSYNLTVSIRKHLLSDLESKYCTFIADRRHAVQRKITEESFGNTRYIGGYCLAKVRQNYIKQLRLNCYNLGIENQARYKESCLILGIIYSYLSMKVALALHHNTLHHLLKLNQSHWQGYGKGNTCNYCSWFY